MIRLRVRKGVVFVPRHPNGLRTISRARDGREHHFGPCAQELLGFGNAGVDLRRDWFERSLVRVHGSEFQTGEHDDIGIHF